MTVSKDYNKHIYEGNGLTVDWPYDFDLPITAAGTPDTSLIHVFRTNLRGEVTEVTAFSVDAETGTLTYPTSGSPLETGEKLTILRLLDVRQQFFDPSNQANLYPEALEDNTDRLVMMLQQLQEETDRAVKVGLSTDLDKEDKTAEGIFEARDIALSAAATAEGYAAQLPAIADELGVNLVADEADLIAKLTTIGASKATLVIATAIPLTDDLSIPSNVSLSFKNTGQLQPASGKTLTINGPIDAGLWQIFGGEGATTGAPQIPFAYPEWFGAAGDGVTDDSCALQTSMTTFPGIPVSLRQTTYACADNVAVPGGLVLYGNGGKIVFSAGQMTVSGGLTELGVLGTAANAGDTTLDIDDPADVAIGDGDILLVWNSIEYSFSPDRAYYYDGEAVHVAAYSDGVVTLNAPLLSSYTAAATSRVFLLSQTTIHISDLCVDGCETSADGLKISTAAYPVLDNVHVRYGRDAAIRLDRCAHAALRGCSGWNDSPSSVGQCYGLVVANCHDVSVTHGTYRGTRHGIASGGQAEDGSIPCRYLSYEDCCVMNDLTSLQHALDSHGNTACVTAIRCTIPNGVCISGRDVWLQDCDISRTDANAPLLAGVWLGGTFNVTGCTIRLIPDETSLFRYLNSEDLESVNTNTIYEFVGNKIILEGAAVKDALFLIGNRQPNTTTLDIRIEGNTITGQPLTHLIRYVQAASRDDSIPVADPRSIIVRDTVFEKDPAGFTWIWPSTTATGGDAWDSRDTLIVLPEYRHSYDVAIASGADVSDAETIAHDTYPRVPDVSVTLERSAAFSNTAIVLPVTAQQTKGSCNVYAVVVNGGAVTSIGFSATANVTVSAR